MVGRAAMTRPAAALLVAFLALAPAALAQVPAVSALVAKKEANLLSFEDKLAAFDAEQAVLAQQWGVSGYHWKGPNGAYGTIISGASIPQAGSQRFCRRFIHIVHHKDDGGTNPTFQGTICRDPGGEWVPE
jgi:surface antigen